MRKLTTEEFIEKSIGVHGPDRYDYSLAHYNGNKEKVEIICNTCGKHFFQTPNSHLSGKGCPFCATKKAALSRSSNTEGFIKKSIVVHGPDKYNYSLVNYKGCDKKVEIICNTCGKHFFQTPDSHLQGRGCPFCAIKKVALSRSSNTEGFIKKSIVVHGPDKYNYSLVYYNGNKEKVEIICNTCGKHFFQIPISHLRGCGCPFCAGFGKTNKDIVEEFENIHGPDKYNYSLVNYNGSKEKVEIICNTCGKHFFQTPDIHLQGKGCPFCAGFGKTNKDIVEEFENIHGPDKYNYSLVNYKGCYKKVEIICNTCGKHFFQTPISHLRGCGCPRCNESHGEIKIGKILERFNIKFETQKRFNECRYKKPLPFDFYVPSKNMAIEFDGIQHFEAVDVFGGDKEFKLVKKRDSIKDNFCKENGIKLLRISYKDADNIEEIIKNNLIS